MTKEELNKIIVTDPEQLRQPCFLVKPEEYPEVQKLLTEHFTGNELGLAANQIGVQKKAIIAKLKYGTHVFINPRIELASPEKVRSTEHCLSLPGIEWSLLRHAWVRVNADAIRVGDVPVPGPMRLRGEDACVFQHEYDHTNGILMTDHTRVESQKEKDNRLRAIEYRKLEKRRARRKVQRNARKRQRR